MKRALLLTLLLAGCEPPPEAPQSGDSSFEMALAQQLPLDFANLKAGDWAVYSIQVQGDTSVERIKYAVVGEEGSAVWLEHTVRSAVIKSKFDRSGKLLEQWQDTPGLDPLKIYPSGQAAPEPPARRDPDTAKPSVEEAAESVTLAGKTYACTRMTTTLTYPDGRRSVMINWCSPDAPLPIATGGQARGGLVKRQMGRFTMELVMFGKDAKPMLTIPTKR